MGTTVPARIRLTDRYAAYLPIGPSTPVVSLGEGSTPLVHTSDAWADRWACGPCS